MNPYAPWTPPFHYDYEGQIILDAKNQRVLDVRGWGFLTGKGSEGLGWMEARAARTQDAMAQRVVGLMNKDASDSAPLPDEAPQGPGV
jgi:hypothetical protein